MIKILLFASLQEEIGSDSLLLEDTECTVKEVKNFIESKYPYVDLQQVLTAVNEEFSNEETIVKSGDIVAFLPPVSGG
ncbi:molybdopterin converting factor subunit 1 [Lysinibacillus sp. SGAir0095]|uniref:molybdopterin converting factor subunit 1 n=1 Tax=Lysinibacillus sp. SGAir0095 TaxID=2070463 RepID=UPI0010CCC27E|nr:molybdopterin converting factor subunit 1 [Lysinibacillus sp. SGAir0095]QCR32367.1 molybdopterin converting factor subunit 1 [Lysinibacillus sp. SGAir0095]